MADLTMPDVSVDGRTWSVIANIAGPDGNLVMAERYADGADIRLTFGVFEFNLNGETRYAATYLLGRGSENRAAASEHFLNHAQRFLAR